jgi:hypothetical protein
MRIGNDGRMEGVMIEEWKQRMTRAWQWAWWISCYYQLKPAQRRALLGVRVPINKRIQPNLPQT